MSAPWLIDATGRHGLLAREMREPDRSTTTLALVRRFRRPGGWGDDMLGQTLLESYEDGWGWSVPLSSETRCVTGMIDQRHADLSGVDVGAMLETELAKDAAARRVARGRDSGGRRLGVPGVALLRVPVCTAGSRPRRRTRGLSSIPCRRTA